MRTRIADASMIFEGHVLREQSDLSFICTRRSGEEIGTCVLTPRGDLFTGDAGAAAQAAASGGLVLHGGRIRGALPRIVFPL